MTTAKSYQLTLAKKNLTTLEVPGPEDRRAIRAASKKERNEEMTQQTNNWQITIIEKKIEIKAAVKHIPYIHRQCDSEQYQFQVQED